MSKPRVGVKPNPQRHGRKIEGKVSIAIASQQPMNQTHADPVVKPGAPSHSLSKPEVIIKPSPPGNAKVVADPPASKPRKIGTTPMDSDSYSESPNLQARSEPQQPAPQQHTPVGTEDDGPDAPALPETRPLLKPKLKKPQAVALGTADFNFAIATILSDSETSKPKQNSKRNSMRNTNTARKQENS